jgi:pimeloyl-ACP methyl ester carboxylesterase
MNAGVLGRQYPNRHFEEANLPSGVTHYQAVGDGPAVVLIHGVSGPLAVWDKLVPALLEGGFRVIRYDLYGRGFSSRLEDAPYDLETYQSQLKELLKALKAEEHLRVIGSSLGAVIAAEFALRNSGRIGELVLIGPAGFPITVPWTARLRDLPVLGPVFTRFLAHSTILKQNDHYFVTGRMPGELRPFVADQLSIPGTTGAILRTMANSPVQSYVQSYRRLADHKFPVRVIWGRQDATFPYENSRILLDSVPRAKLLTVDRCGHLPQYERAEIVAPALVEMLSGR